MAAQMYKFPIMVLDFPTKRCDRLPRSSKAAATPKARFSARGFARAELAKRGYWHRTNCRGAGVIIGARIQSRARIISP